MSYNMDFLIAGLVFLALVLYHFSLQNRMADLSSRIFMGFIVIGILDILFDLISSVLIKMGNPEFQVVTNLSLIIFYLMQVFLPFGMFLYMRSLWLKEMDIRKGIARELFIPTATLAGLVLMNCWLHLFFKIDDGQYVRGPLYAVVYFHALFYMAATAWLSMRHREELGEKKLHAVWEILMLITVCVLLQMIFRSQLLIGFGIALGISVFFYTINNPKEYLDNLTGVYDNRYFAAVVQDLIERKKMFHLVTVDIRTLKQMNSIYGTHTGNQILVCAAQRIQQVSESGHVFRTHGNRFVALTYSFVEYEQVRNRLEQAFRTPMELKGESISFPVTICGITDGAKLIHTDQLLSYIEYLVSLTDGSRELLLIQDDEQIMRGFRHSMEVEAFLKTAIEQDLFEVNYQPVYSIQDQQYVTLEVLSRLSHPRLGAISPEIFITIAERNGQIAQIGYLQLKRVCRFLSEHRKIMRQIQNIKFNLSPAEMMTQGHCERLLQTIQEFGLPYSYFQFEITETVATEYSDNLYEMVRIFTEAGIGLCLDDFGSGFANLNTVLKLPFTSIKIDRSLLIGIDEEPKAALFYQNIVSVLQNMGYFVISEGVETRQEMELLSSWGVNMIQGYYFSKPVSEKEIVELVLNPNPVYNRKNQGKRE